MKDCGAGFEAPLPRLPHTRSAAHAAAAAARLPLLACVRALRATPAHTEAPCSAERRVLAYHCSVASVEAAQPAGSAARLARLLHVS
jgi:hypothetical protein